MISNVTRIVDIAKAAKDAGTDAVTCINTVLGMAVDWRRRKPLIGNAVGGNLAGRDQTDYASLRLPSSESVGVPVIGVGGIATIDDCMEFLIAGASAIQAGTATYYDPHASVNTIGHYQTRFAHSVQRRLPTSSAVYKSRNSF